MSSRTVRRAARCCSFCERRIPARRMTPAIAELRRAEGARTGFDRGPRPTRPLVPGHDLWARAGSCR